MKSPLRIIPAMIGLCFALFTMSAMAQTTTTGSIEGTVVDVNGAAVPGVTVTATRAGGRSLSATTNDDGVYRLQQLEPGQYKVVVESAQGFAKFEQANVPVNLSKTSNLAIQLRPQGAAETVEVTASGGADIDVTQNTTGTNISTEQFSKLPDAAHRAIALHDCPDR